MDFEIEIVPRLDNKPIKSVLAEPRKAPETMPDRPFIAGVIASRGGGKTTSVINLVKIYATTHFFDKVILLSPTYYNDTKLQTLQDPRYEFIVHTDITPDIVNDVIDSIKADIEEYKKFKEYIKVWNRFVRAKNVERWLDNADPAEIALLQDHDYEPPQTQWTRGMPQTLVIADDLVGNRAIYNNPTLLKFLLVHRHYLTSFVYCSQVWKGAIPRGIRNNLSFLMLFTNKSKQVRREIAEELASHITVEQFEAIWDYACQEPHDCLYINYDDPRNRFKRNFNEIIKIKSVSKVKEDVGTTETA